tara:strand:+ start:453 stop:815 length:363 start_codon:yes stop_codon:yes gene_type:complete
MKNAELLLKLGKYHFITKRNGFFTRGNQCSTYEIVNYVVRIITKTPNPCYCSTKEQKLYVKMKSELTENIYQKMKNNEDLYGKYVSNDGWAIRMTDKNMDNFLNLCITEWTKMGNFVSKE